MSAHHMAILFFIFVNINDSELSEQVVKHRVIKRERGHI